MKSMRVSGSLAYHLGLVGLLLASPLTQAGLVISSQNDTFTPQTYTEPLDSLTINLGGNPAGTKDHLTLKNLGTLNTSLIVNGGLGFDQVTVTGDLQLPGQDLQITADKIVVEQGALISTRDAVNNDDGVPPSRQDSGNILLIAEYHANAVQPKGCHAPRGPA